MRKMQILKEHFENAKTVIKYYISKEYKLEMDILWDISETKNIRANW